MQIIPSIRIQLEAERRIDSGEFDEEYDDYVLIYSNIDKSLAESYAKSSLCSDVEQLIIRERINSMNDGILQSGFYINKIQDELSYMGLKYPPSKIEFPKGYFKKVNEYIDEYLFFLNNHTIKRNMGYHFLALDMYYWFFHNFDLCLTAKEMLIKDIIGLLGNIIDGIIDDITNNSSKIKIYNEKLNRKSILINLIEESSNDKNTKNILKSDIGRLYNKNMGFKRKLTLLVDNKIISKDQKNNIENNIWNIRCSEHIANAKELEYNKYTEDKLALAKDIFYNFIETLKEEKRIGTL